MAPPFDVFLDGLRESIVAAVARTTPDLPAQGGYPAVRREVAVHLAQLGVAVALDEPRLFAAHVAWSRALGGKPGATLLARCLEVIESALAASTDVPADTPREALRLAREIVATVRGGTRPRTPAELEVVAYLDEASAGRRPAALARVERWRREDGPVAALLRLADAQREIGERWFAGAAPVAVEHRVTAVSAVAVGRLTVPPNGTGRAVVACAPGDFHTTGPAIAAALLSHRGWNVETPGADTPAAELARLVADVRPGLVGIGVALLAALPGARDAALAARAAWPDAIVVAGGWAARVAGPGLLGVHRVVPATFAGDPSVPDASLEGPGPGP